ncbi:putative bifunctional diguanylate cyclase/phosphodiesterase [Dactylosporangium sucinum]|uniref:putative bifunctional diguanylate cyclase/phosphodiesterase n=1 Tax=Dactylosporangium sucinum TaxID=1424081 RepID=UPI001E5290A2|nr:EAL domain-containing protein [Dactylosporangium sucinum]
MLARTLSAWFAVWMGLLTVAFYRWPGMHMLWWGAIGLSSTAGVVVGVLVHRPRRRWPWFMLATALFMFGAGDFLYNVATDVFGLENPFPSFPDALYLAMYPLVAAGLLGFIRSRTGRNNRESLLDAATLTIGLALLSWLFLIDPYVRNDELTLLQKLVSVAYPLGDVLTLAVFARLLTGGVKPFGSINFLGLGTAGLLIADVIYGLIQLNGNWHVGGPTDLGWVLCYFGWAAAALHPSMVRMTEPTRSTSGDLSVRRIALLGAASLIAPSLLLVEASIGKAFRDAAVIGTASAVMFVLVLTRLAGVMGDHRQSLARERELREATATLVSAADAGEAVSAVRHSLARLLPAGTPHKVVVVRAERADEPGLIRVSGLGPELRAQLREFSSVLRHPLGIENDVLYLAGPTEALQALQPTFEVLGAQAAMALERITLSAEVSRRSSEAYFRTLIHNTADVILIVDDNDVIQYASPSAGPVFGDERLAGYELWEFIARDEHVRLAGLLAQVRGGSQAHVTADARAERVDGTGLVVEVDCRDLRADPTVGGLVLTVRDVTERRRLEEQLIRQAFHDSLTGLANRVLFQDRVEQSVARATRDGSLVGVVFVDLDDFKIVNDTLGHAVGDALLKAVGERISGELRDTDTVARLGGDEFAALIESDSMADLELAAERIVIALGEQFTVAGETVNGISSVGLSTTVDASTAEELMRQADLALYVAKGAGKGQWRRYQSDVHTAVLERLELRAALDQAVKEQQFMLQYQPIVDLDTGVPLGFEALVRWNHPTRGMIAPGHFIEVAEESGLIVPMGRMVLQQALNTAGRWQRATAPGALRYISVNVSARQFRTPGFVEEVRQMLHASGVEPGTLLLEITESLLLRNDDQVRADLDALRAMGVRLAIDDFGTGYSSLSYLQHMPIDVLKIDKSFIDDMLSSSQQRAVVNAIVQLAQTFNLSVVAEGVEEPGQREALRQVGCPYGQGYLFARPLSEPDAFALIPKASPFAAMA